MKFLELNPVSPKSVKQKFLEVFSDKIKEELGVKQVKCPVCSKNDAEAWVKILDVESFADTTPHAIIGKISHCVCINCGVLFVPITIKEKKELPGNYTSYHEPYHFYVSVRYSIDGEKLRQLLRR